ncbi:hypothetical protein DPMN_141905 [Dreissena polymorpha]|uniref:Carboxylesterase type B domain-containing protein n=1 Tax=Dreissena polymorpha TaxID=45954 RepID=A0A9D4GAV5_DREPO|nr:hypothetical protein DPMN_141905 [Dreissena polymorpha]
MNRIDNQIVCLIVALVVYVRDVHGGVVVRRLGDRIIRLDKQGSIRGVSVEFTEAGHKLKPVERFSGLQYGTLRGNRGSMLRFMAPSSSNMASWGEKVREFTVFSPVCPHPSNTYAGITYSSNGRSEITEVQKEDCLYLNLWAPIPGIHVYFAVDASFTDSATHSKDSTHKQELVAWKL